MSSNAPQADARLFPAGAVFHRCALQVNPHHYGQTFRGQTSSGDATKHATDIVDNALALGISVIAITDHNDVSGVNFWDDEPDNGKDKVRGSIRHQRTLGFWDGDESASMMTLNHWIADRDNKVLLIEKRHTELRPLPDATSWLLIVDSEFIAPKGESATFEPSGFGLMSARMAKTIGVHDGNGRIMNSEGQVNEKEVFRKPAKWCDYTGRVTNDEKGFAGITLLNHPQNPNNPTAFHVRDDGWMCSCLSLENPVVVDDTKPLHVRTALWVHEGAPTKDDCEAMWRRFAEMPLPDMNNKKP